MLYKLAKIILLYVWLAWAAAIAQPSAVTELQRLLGNINTLQADFTQHVYSEQKVLLHTYSGKVEFKKPRQLRWQVEQPDSSLLVTDGKKVWNYDVALEQVSVQKYSTNDNEVMPLSFILDDSNKIERNFVVEGKATNCFKLTPRQENPNFVHVVVCFKSSLLNSIEIFDHLGQTSMFNFSKIQKNIKISAARFIFNPPVGVDIVGEQ